MTERKEEGFMSTEADMPPTMDAIQPLTEPAFAWQAEDYPSDWKMPVPAHQRIKTAAKYGLPALGVALAAVFIFGTHAPQQVQSAPVTAAPIVLPPAPPAPPSQDDLYIDMLNKTFPEGHKVANRDVSVKEGRYVCEYLADNHSMSQMINYLDSVNVPFDKLTQDAANKDGIHAALKIYCPERDVPEATDNAFLAVLSADGSGINESSVGVNNAKLVCHDVAIGTSRDDLIGQIRQAVNGYTTNDAKNFVNLSQVFYCP